MFMASFWTPSKLSESNPSLLLLLTTVLTISSPQIIESGPKVFEVPEFQNSSNRWEFKEQNVNSSNYIEVLTTLTSVSPLYLLLNPYPLLRLVLLL